MRPKQQRLKALIWQRIEEYVWHRVLLLSLEVDIEARRQLEALQKAAFEERRSVHVERSREQGQDAMAVVHQEIDAYLDLLAQGAPKHE